MPRHPARSGRASTASKTRSKPYDKHRKFRRKRVYDLFTPPEIPPKKDFLQRLPVELLAEILKLSSSITVLAVARTCKWLCETLIHEDQEFIWKAARRNGDLPDPPPGFSEPAYASAIFDVGNCLVCPTFTSNAIEAQTLNVPKLTELSLSLSRTPKYLLLRESNLFQERMSSLTKANPPPFRYFTSTLVIPDVVDKEILGDLLPRALFRWNMEFVDDFQGVGITVIRWRVAEREIAKEVAILAEVRIRRSEERARVRRQEDVEQLWRGLTQSRPDKGHYSVPPLNIFLSLPLIRNATKTHIADTWPRLDEGHAFLALLDTEISGWARNTQRTLAAALGYKRTGGKSKTAAEHQKDLQEFLNRATSLFECSKCRRTRPIEHEQWTTMTHREVTQHRCPKGTMVMHVDPSTGEQRTKENRDWNVHNFVPDKIAIAAIRLALSVADPPFDESASLWTVGLDDRFEEFPRYVCLTCPSRITMSIWEIPGHAKRHKSLFEASQKTTSGGEGGMSFELGWVVTELCTKKGVSIRSNLYEHMEQLMSNTPGGRRKRALREYACRHCEFSSATRSRAVRLFTIDGLQSHLKSSHGIYPLRNEDFCHVRKISPDNLERFTESEENPKDSGRPRSDVAAFGGVRIASDDPESPTSEQLVEDEDDN
ncbi:hypothetical protein FS837_008935 [Tulasnella sp. UAMH 9824]|nr:hypothetical protein FS837_008935 [Tulasnella sp. UAMH 9824]